MKNSILIFAPHPDDETLGCAGEIVKAIKLGETVNVVVITNGDGFTKAASANSKKKTVDLLPDDYLAVARLRQNNVFEATKILGLKTENIYFLGYPDGGLNTMMNLPDNVPFTNPYTQKSQTYGLVYSDYHSQKYGKTAPYIWSAAIKDVSELIQTLQPKRIYITDKSDGHADHRAAFHLICEAAISSGFKGEIYTYLVHSSTGTWPWPRGSTPDKPFELHREDNNPVPNGIIWPPHVRYPLTPTMVAKKIQAIHAYDLEMSILGEYIESFIKSEEIFWQYNLNEYIQQK